jgi:5-methylcytosine-specific restriction endonuclease McrA
MLSTIFQQSIGNTIHHPTNQSHICALSAQNLVKIINIPDIQRELDNEHALELKENQMKRFNEMGSFDFGILDVCIYDDTLYLINGQHRYKVLQDLMTENLEHYSSIPIYILVRTVKSKLELDQLWSAVNNSKPMALCKNVENQAFCSRLRKYLQLNYSKYLVRSARPSRPHINLDLLQEKIMECKFFEDFPNLSDIDLIREIETLNRFYMMTSYVTWKSWNIKQFDRLIGKCNDKLTSGAIKPFYIGIYNNFEWLNRIMYKLKNKTEYGDVMHYCGTNRVKINKKRRREVWEKRNGSSSTQGACFVCQQHISIHDFECGHVNSVFYGGGIELSNLEPICRECNNAMSADNLEDYKTKMYPDS